eukprot:2104042-Rhodomonas_salina.1
MEAHKLESCSESVGLKTVMNEVTLEEKEQKNEAWEWSRDCPVQPMRKSVQACFPFAFASTFQ